MNKDSKILILGGTGFIGSNITKHLKDLGYTDVSISSSRYYDLTIKDCTYTLFKTVKPEYVFNCAAVTFGASVIQNNVMSMFHPNIIINANILEASKVFKVKKLQMISSSVVYPSTDVAVMEEDAVFDFFEKYKPISWMKRFMEISAQMYTEKSDLAISIVRPANLYGPFDHFDSEKSHVIPALISKVVKNEEQVEVWGDGKEEKDFLYIDDFVEGAILAMNADKKFSIYNISSEIVVSINSIVQILFDNKGKKLNIVYNGNAPKMISKRIISNKLARKELGFRPKIDIIEGLGKTYSWYKSK